MVVNSGDTFNVEMCTQHAGDDPAKMITGDPGIESIYTWNEGDMGVAWRGRSGHGDGVHVLTGPVWVCGAEPGDVLQVDILDLKPRINPSTGKAYGSNAAASWGYQFVAGFLDGIKREVITIYELMLQPGGDAYVAVPDYQFRYGQWPGSPNQGYRGPVTNCTITTGSMQNIANGLVETFDNTAETFRKNLTVPCVTNNQSWPGYLYPGILTSHPTGSEDYSIRGKFKVPVNFHIGNIGLAQDTDATQDSVPPFESGGNVDDRRIGVGATMYYPVKVAGALLSMGDAHTAQGDSELDGTAIETSINGQFKVTLLKANSLPAFATNLNFPLLENDEEWIVQGYTYTDPLNIPGDGDPNDIYNLSDLDLTMKNAYNQTRDFMMRAFNLTEDQTITAITALVDFSVTQVVDGNYGIHASIPKWAFTNINDTNTPYTGSKVIPGSSRPVGYPTLAPAPAPSTTAAALAAAGKR